MTAEEKNMAGNQDKEQTVEENKKEEKTGLSEENTADGEIKPEEVADGKSQDSREKLEEDFNKLKNDYIRLYAEMDNMKKRAQQETEKTIKFAVSSFAKELLTVADNMDRAVAAMADKKETCAELLKGIELTQNELTRVFEKFGIKRFNHIGQKFDPNYERVVQEIEDKKAKSGVILAELQAGYTIHERILREAMVVVAR